MNASEGSKFLFGQSNQRGHLNGRSINSVVEFGETINKPRQAPPSNSSSQIRTWTVWTDFLKNYLSFG